MKDPNSHEERDAYYEAARKARKEWREKFGTLRQEVASEALAWQHARIKELLEE